MDALLLPSRFEGLPLALMEAQCAGLPCLVSDAVTKEAAVTELVTSLPLGNAEKWAVRLADMTQSAERRGEADRWPPPASTAAARKKSRHCMTN